MLIPSAEATLDELRALAEKNGFPRNVVKSYSMVVYDIPDEAYHGKKRRGRPPKAQAESDQGANDGD